MTRVLFCRRDDKRTANMQREKCRGHLLLQLKKSVYFVAIQLLLIHDWGPKTVVGYQNSIRNAQRPLLQNERGDSL